MANEVDNAPYYKNPDQTDSDNNGVGDVAEPDGDGDGDGVANATDNCASISNADQNDLDKDGIGDACDEDRDGDGVRNDLDICPDVANPLQDSSTVVNSTSCLVAVAEIELFDFLHVYPNPASDQLFVELLPARPGRLAVELYDPTGKRLYRTEVEATRQAMTLRLPVDHLPRGVYYLRLADGQRSIGRKVVIH
nr:thrombospondin type 3 repeat-containing protein [Neolewinella aquimaris]